MLPSRHILTSFPLAIICGYFFNSILAGLLCFLSGILIDLDHLVDCLLHYGLKCFNLKGIYQACAGLARREEEGGPRRLYLFLHATEIAILLWAASLFTHNIYLFAIALGYTGHLILDVTANTLRPRAYFICWRIKCNFKTGAFLRKS